MRGLALALWVAVMVLSVGATAAPRKAVIDALNEIHWPAGARTVHGPRPVHRGHEFLEE